MQTIDLSGVWRYRTDEEDRGLTEQYYSVIFGQEGFRLPGSTCDNRIGKVQQFYQEFSKEAVRAPRERYEYIAPLWLQREIVIPQEWEGKEVCLYLERVNIASELWVDGEQIGRQTIELSVPHVYRLTGKTGSGVHTLTLRIDNRNLLNLDTMASGYSVDTQGYWNGIIGRIELQCRELIHIDAAHVYPRENGIDVRVTERSDQFVPLARKEAWVELAVRGKDEETAGAPKRYPVTLFASRQTDYFSYDMADIRWWDEFHPFLYRLTVRLCCGESCDEMEVDFGMRIVDAKEKQFHINGRPFALRGTIDCAQYPMTGYPPMEPEIWKKNFAIIKSYGLNHVRFHAWCPPESAFAAADELGLYLSVEMPLWLNRDVCALEFGDDAVHRTYFTQEAAAISETYGNHPSFLMFSNGNENMGDFALLEAITTQVKALDGRRLYTLTSNFDHPVYPCEDYLCAFELYHNKARIQDIQDIVAEDTCLDYAGAVEQVPVPAVSFEVGQYCVYPDVDIVEQYTGNMLPVNFDVIRKEMVKKNVYHRLREYVQASGDLAVKLYKEDIEAALRTKGFGGFELLSLIDYTGQSTATVGILDVLYRSKGLVSAEEWRSFCGPVVPLFRAKRIFCSRECLDAELSLYDFGEKPQTEPEYHVSIRKGDELFYETVTRESHIQVSLSKFTKPTQLTVTIAVGSHHNSWRIFVYPYEEEKTLEQAFAEAGGSGIAIIRNPQQLEQAMEEGGRGIVLAGAFEHPIDAGFIPVFWSPVHFPSQKPCGAMIDETHPVFRGFPTGHYPDYQWKNLLDHAKCVAYGSFPQEIDPIVEMVPNYVDNTPASPLFEANLGKARLLFCGFDLEGTQPEVKALRESVAAYLCQGTDG